MEVGVPWDSRRCRDNKWYGCGRVLSGLASLGSNQYPFNKPSSAEVVFVILNQGPRQVHTIINPQNGLERAFKINLCGQGCLGLRV